MSASPLHLTLVDDSDLAQAGLTSLLAPFADRVAVVDNRTAIARPTDIDVVLYEPVDQSSMARSLLRDLQEASNARAAVFSWAGPTGLPTQTTNPYFAKSLTASQLVVLVEKLASGRLEAEAETETGTEAAPHPAPQVGLAPVNVEARVDEVGLTPREGEIVGLIVTGMSNREIGETLTLSINSVKTYIRSAYRKMGVERRTQAVLWGLSHGMGQEPRPALVS